MFIFASQVSVVVHIVDDVIGVTQLHNVVYVVYHMYSSIVRFNAATHQRLTDFNKNLRLPLGLPCDIAACKQTSQLYLVNEDMKCIWRVSADGADINRWWSKSSSDTFRPWKLSVTSTRLLVRAWGTNQLMQLDAVGNELRRVQLPDYMEPGHAVESPTGTFIVSHDHRQLGRYQVSEVNTDGKVLRHVSFSRLRSHGRLFHIAVDSHANIFVADTYNCRILLLNAQLELRRVIIDEDQLNYERPRRLCYSEQSGQLLVGYIGGVAVFDVLHH